MSFAILRTFFTRLQEQEIISVNKQIEKTFNLAKIRGEQIVLKEKQFTFAERVPMIQIKEYREKREAKVKAKGKGKR